MSVALSLWQHDVVRRRAGLERGLDVGDALPGIETVDAQRAPDLMIRICGEVVDRRPSRLRLVVR